MVFASVCAGSTCAKRARSSSASTRRSTRSACAFSHASVRSLSARLRKLSYSAASRRYLSLRSATSRSSRATASSGGSSNAPPPPPPDPWGCAASAPAACGCLSLSSMVLRFFSNRCAACVRRFGTKLSYYLEPPSQKSHQVAEHLVALRVVQHLVVHLRVPADPHAALQPVGERARLMRVYHAILPCQQKQQRRLDAIAVRHHGPLGPLDLTPRTRCHHPLHVCILGVRLIQGRIPAQRVGIESRGNRQGGPQVREDAAADELPCRRSKREPEPGPGDHRTGDRAARLRLEVAQRHEPPAREPEQHRRAPGANGHHAAAR